jgi:NAD(P)-dependent dehydrogenase (short-subunit alcohol dehydrogenase family)
MGRLEGKVAVVTGATSGIGARTAELFVREGASVVLAGRRAERGQRLGAEIGAQASLFPTQIRVEADVRAVIDHALARFGRLDCLVNNAGTIPTGAGVAEIELGDFDAAIAIHVRSVLAGMKHAAPILVRQRSGSIVNMSSIVGIRAGIGSLAYSTAKAAVLHLTRAAAIELGEHGIRVNSVSPGPVVTGIFGKGSGVEDERADEAPDVVRAAFAEILPEVQPLPRVGTAEDVARAVLFLASDDSSFVTGHDLVVDGGSMAGRPARVMRAHGAAFQRAFSGTAPSRGRS